MSSEEKNGNVLVAKLSGVGKHYPPVLTPARLLRYLWPAPIQPRADDFWALRNLSIELPKGQVLGVIGRNGSGKSTLLQLIAGLLEPSEGDVSIDGTVAALLELGAGFNPEFTGRENIFLSGQIYGYGQDRMREKFDDIVSFASIGEHLDQPVKTYSSGMFARLAFAVAIQVDPDILLVDEILSVGDVGFQAKCFRKIESLRKSGTSIVFVSHDLNSVQMLSDKVLYLRDGKVAAYEDPKMAVSKYVRDLMLSGVSLTKPGSKGIDASQRKALIEDADLLGEDGTSTLHPRSGRRCTVRYRVKFQKAVESPVFTLQFKAMLGVVVADITSLGSGVSVPPCDPGDVVDVEFKVTLNLCPGPFRLGVSVAEVSDEGVIPLHGFEAMTIEVLADSSNFGIAYVEPACTVRKGAQT